ncbi:glycosyltransferase family 9 protein [Fusobacterium sp. MFO224]|uniref:glycosyltransferase family 9 protein n=1 Tax=Fusobacterium sp. MFO224 TaxID=3378070 RepID=UPI0038525844
MKILVIRLSSIGDIILTTPILKQLKRKYPNIIIDFLVMKNFKDSISGLPYIDNLIIFDKKKNDSLKNLVLFGKKLSKNNYDYVFDLHNKLRSFIISKNINSKILVYPKRKLWKSILVKMRIIKYHADDTIIKNYFKPFNFLGLKYEEEDLTFPFSKNDLKNVTKYKSHFVMAPGASKETKKWTIEGFANLAKLIHQKYKIKPILIGGNIDIDRCDKINKISGDVCINLAGRLSLKESGALLSISKALITNDSGPFHISRGVKCPTYAIFGPTDPNMFEYDDKNKLIYSNISCSPCSLHGDSKCPRNHFNCMKNITANLIFEKIKKDFI